jgi:phosphonate transport system substrate-binding protein
MSLQKSVLPIRNIFDPWQAARPAIRVAIVWIAAMVGMVPALADPLPLRIGLTPIIAYDQVALIEDLRKYLESKSGRRVEFARRESYRQAIDLLAQDQLDCAWVSVYPYVYLQYHYNLRLLATPVFRGRPFFRGYLIVPAEDTATGSLLQLGGKVFAFADLYSFTGYLLPRYELHEAGKDAASFFAKTFFTKGHKRVVQAVASGLADGGYVDSYIWDTLAATEPQLTAKTRVVEMSALHGFPPLVASRKMSARDFVDLRRILLEMSSDPEGKRLLGRMSLDGFVAGDPAWYAEAARMMKVMGDI